MQNKALEWKRLGIYLLLANGLSWIPWLILNAKLGGFMEWSQMPEYSIFFTLSAYGPAAANVLTRLITKEGWKDSLLHLRVKGNIRYYLFGLFFPIACALLAALILGNVYDFGLQKKDVASYLGLILYLAGMAISIAFYTFGEEFGWRGYMNQKLESLLGTTGAVLVGGFFWGIWHAPLTVTGHNFGTDYWGFPWLGVVLMCLMCTGFGAAMMWVTKKTDSVYPTSIMHASLNFVCSAVTFAMVALPEEMSGQENFRMEICYLLPVTVIGFLFLPVMLIEQKKKVSVSPEMPEDAKAA